MQPRNSIDEITEAMAKRFDHDDDRLVETTHLRYWIENAVEALAACEAVQQAREQQMDVLHEQVADLNQQVLNHVADQAVLQRQLDVKTKLEDTALYFRPDSGTPEERDAKVREWIHDLDLIGRTGHTTGAPKRVKKTAKRRRPIRLVQDDKNGGVFTNVKPTKKTGEHKATKKGKAK
jgi:DNA-binding transcriptional MerR regulator